MANTFTRKTSRGIGTALTAVGGYTVPAATQVTAIGLTVANTTTSSITVDVVHHDGTNATYLLKGASIIPGQALVPIGGEQKLVLQTGDSIRIQSSVASSVDAVMSCFEIA